MHEDLCGFQLGYVSVWTRKGSGSLIPPHLSLHPCAHSLLSTRQNLHLMALERFYSALPLNGCTLKKTFVLLSALLSWPFLNSSSFPFSFFFFLQRALYISRNGRWDMFQRNIIQGLPFLSLQEIQHTLNFSCLIPLALPLKISLGDTLCVKSPLHLRFDFHSNKTIPEITLSLQISHWIFGKIII